MLSVIDQHIPRSKIWDTKAPPGSMTTSFIFAERKNQQEEKLSLPINSNTGTNIRTFNDNLVALVI